MPVRLGFQWTHRDQRSADAFTWEHSLTFPAWFLALVSGALPAYWAATHHWRTRHKEHPSCPACGYNLTANLSGTCPECGTAIS